MFRSAFHVIILSIILLSPPLSAQEGIRQVSSHYNFWDEAKDIAVRGDYVYVASGSSGLQVIDISDHENPEIVTCLEIVGNALWLEIIDDYAYVGNYLYRNPRPDFSVIDISDPDSPEFIRFLPVEGDRISGFSWDNNLACVISYSWTWVDDRGDFFEYFLTIFDIEQRRNPTQLFSRITYSDYGDYWIGFVWSPLVRGNHIYLRTTGNLCVLDISDPRSPEVIAEANVPGNPVDTNSENTILYSVDRGAVRNGRICLTDISDPEEPELISEFSELGGPIDLIADDTLVYATFLDNVFGIINAAEPDSPELLGELQIEEQFGQLDLGEDLAASITGPRDFKLIDLSDVENPEISGSYSHPEGAVLGIEKIGNLVYVAAGKQGLYIAETDDLDYLLSCCDTPGEANKVAVSDGFAHVADADSGMCIIDVSDPEYPFIISQFTFMEDTLQGKAIDITVEGNYVYLLTEQENLLIIDISDRENPCSVGCIENVTSSQLDGENIYVSHRRWRRLRVFDISDKSDPEELYYFDVNGEIQGFKIIGDRLIYVGFFDGSVGHDYYDWEELIIYDISDHEQIYELGDVRLNDEANFKQMKVEHDYAFIVYYKNLHVWRISNPEHMQRVGYHPVVGKCRDLEIDGSTVYSANYSNLDIYDCSDVVHVSEEESQVTISFNLHPAHPNPFNASAVLRFTLPVAGEVVLAVYDVEGRRVVQLEDRSFKAGDHSVAIDAEEWSSGVYLARLEFGGEARTVKMVVVR